MWQGIESIPSPKQQQRPLPSLLSLSFFYGVHRALDWRTQFVKSNRCKFTFLNFFVVVWKTSFIRKIFCIYCIPEYRAAGWALEKKRGKCFIYIRASFICAVWCLHHTHLHKSWTYCCLSSRLVFCVQRFKLLYISFWPHGFTVIKAISDLDIFKFIDSKSSRYV